MTPGTLAYAIARSHDREHAARAAGIPWWRRRPAAAR